MGTGISHSDDPIDRLLQERQQYAVWLARLDSTRDAAPEAVRTRVRADYQARLETVIEQLRTHSQGLATQLERHRETRAELLTREAQAREIMSEAEVRHAVGEYGEDKWQQIQGEAQRNLDVIQGELNKVNGEISELEKVQGLIAAPAVPPPAPTAPAARESPASPTPARDSFPELSAAIDQAMANEKAPAPPRVETPAASAGESPSDSKPAPGQTTARPAAGGVRPVKPKEAGGAAPGRTLWFPSVKEEEINSGVDELAFLKSVSEDEKTGPSPRRASGGVPRPAEALTPSAPAAPPTPVPTGEGRPSTSTGQRTLKCGECGTMNRPTEWYCERCGAELADL